MEIDELERRKTFPNRLEWLSKKPIVDGARDSCITRYQLHASLGTESLSTILHT